MAPKKIGHYEIKKELGRGGMATVYLGYDARLERDVAVKVLPRKFLHDPTFEARFQREAKTIAKLEHAAIVPIYDFGEDDGQLYLVMRYMQGGSLADKLEKGKLLLDDVVEIFSRIGPALDKAHSKKIIHRDIKPGNILFDDQDQAYLADFGLAKISQDTGTLTGNAVIGTPAYISPEQAMGEKHIDGRSDLYSLGVTLFEALTGEIPFEGDTPVSSIIKHLNDPIPNIGDFNPDLPAELQAVIDKILAKEAGDRYATAAEFTAALQAVAVGTPLATTEIIHVPVDEPAVIHDETKRLPSGELEDEVGEERPASGRKWMLLGVGGLIGLLGICIIAGLIYFANAANPPPTSVSDDTLGDTDTSNETGTDAGGPKPEVADSNATTALVVTTGPTSQPDPADILTTAPSIPTGKIVFTCQISRTVGRDQICIINADGSGLRTLTSATSFENAYPSLAPDGNSLVYISNKNGADNVYELSLSGSEVQLTDFPAGSYAPEISPDGQWIVFTNIDGITSSLWVMPRDGSGARNLVTLSNDIHDPVWSPNGEQILFSSGPHDPTGVNWNRQFFIINLDGSGLQQVTDIPGFRGRSDWSPIEDLFSAYRGPNGDRSIVLLNFSGNVIFEFSTGGDSVAPSYSPDGQWIVFMSYRDNPENSDGCEIYIMRIDGSDITRLTNNNYCDFQPRWGP